jgi:acyl carrier protein
MIKRLNLEQMYINKGLRPITENNGMQVMYRLIGQNIGYAAVVEADWDRVLDSGPRSKTSYLEDLRQKSDAGVEAILSDAEKQRVFTEKFVAADDLEKQLLVAQELKAIVSHCLRIKKDQLDTSIALVEMGMDSMLAVEMSNRIGLLFGISITLIDLISANSFEHISAKLFDELKQKPELQSEEELLDGITDEELLSLIEEIESLSLDEIVTA